MVTSPRFLPRWRHGALALAVVAVLAVPGSSAATPRLHECQHPVRTGEEAYRLRNISVAAACRAVLALGRWEYQDHHVTQLYGCRRPRPDQAGYPFLRLRSFYGYRLSIARDGSFVMSRGRSSFAVAGTDFPLNCS